MVSMLNRRRHKANALGGGGSNGKLRIGEHKKPENPGIETNYLGQLAMVAFMIVPWITLLFLSPSTFSKDLRSKPFTPTELAAAIIDEFKLKRATKTFDYFQDVSFQLLLAHHFVPHFFYFLIWVKPLWVHKACSKLKFLGNETHQVIAKIAHTIKISQVLSFVWYFYPVAFNQPLGTSIQSTISFMRSQDFLTWLCFVQMVVLGQFLNMYVYKVLGEVGVYYGPKFGKKLPWITGFPYNVISDGQYVGSVLTIWGICIMLATDYSVDRGLYGFAAAIGLYYSFSGYIEGNL